MTSTLINDPSGITEGSNLTTGDTAVVGSNGYDEQINTGTIQAKTVNNRQWYWFNSSLSGYWRWNASFVDDALCSSLIQVRFGSAPGSAFEFALHRNGSSSSAARWDFNSSLVPRVINNAGSLISSFTALSTNTDYYLALATDATNTTVEAKIYEGTTLSQTLAKTTTTTGAAQASDFRIGKYTAASGDLYLGYVKVVSGSTTLLTPPATGGVTGYRKLVMYQRT